MMQIAFIAVAAGAASALLFASVSSGSLLSIPLFNLAPLPILIAGIGWNHLAALGAAMVAALALAAVFGSQLFISFLLGVGLPGWGLAYLVLLARPAAMAASGETEWYPVGRIVVWSALISALVVSLVMLMIATDAEELRAALRKPISMALRIPGGEAESGNASARLPLMPMLLERPDLVLLPAAAILTSLMHALTLWLAARVVRVSGRLQRPWPDLSAMRFPPMVLTLLAIALLCAMLPGMFGLVGIVAVAALSTAYALLGLAVMHALTRAIGGRTFILGSLYGGIAVFGWPFLFVALLGLVDTWLDLRARLPRPGPPAPRT
jgi:hypothetical protein